ncbi:MAG: extracellular solute-binding protein [Lachnospiraceae bacterium]|nr:extracellular solute-binding protein [Lachnospiraceae bacterium]
MKKNLSAKVTGALLAAAMLLSACAAGNTAAGTAAPETSADAAEAPAVEAEAPAAEMAETAEAPAESEGASGEWEGDIDEIEIVLFDIANGNEGTEPIVAAANAITEKTIGVRASINYIPFGDYITQLNLILTSSEPVDIINFTALPGANFSTLMANGQLMDITEYMDEYGTGISSLMGDYLGATSMDDSIYGVPTYRSYGSSSMLIMREDVLEEVGMVDKARSASTWTDIEEIFAAVAEKTDVSPIGGGQIVGVNGGSIYGEDAFSDAIVFDTLGDTNYLIYNNNGELSLLPEKESFRTQQDRVRNWYNNGYVYKDSILDSTDPTVLISNGAIMTMGISGEIGAEESWSDRLGTPVVGIELNRNLLRASSINSWGMAVPVTADEPEAAVRWLNELYTNPDLENILVWGIEGEDYTVNDGVAAYPEGTDATTARYHKTEFAYGNYFNLLPWDGTPANFREIAMEYSNEFEVSPYSSFNADLSEQNNLIAALTTTISKYKGDIFCGAFTDEEYDSYVSDLKTAGVEELIATYQEQLNAYLGK